MSYKAYSVAIHTISIAISVILVGSLWFLAWYVFPREAPAAILHYSVGVGVDFIGEGNTIFVLPALATILVVVNSALAFIIRRASQRATYLIWIGTPPIVAVLLVASGIIWRLNA